MNTPSDMENRNVSDAPLFDPFPEPQTMPKGWDFSGIMPTESLPAVEAAQDAAES